MDIYADERISFLSLTPDREKINFLMKGDGGRGAPFLVLIFHINRRYH